MKVVAWMLSGPCWDGIYYTRWHVDREDGKTKCGMTIGPHGGDPEEWDTPRFLHEVSACENCKRVVRKEHR